MTELSGPVIRSYFEVVRLFPTVDIRHRWQRRPEPAITSAQHFLILQVVAPQAL